MFPEGLNKKGLFVKIFAGHENLADFRENCHENENVVVILAKLQLPDFCEN
jgi:hypothetical protein